MVNRLKSLILMVPRGGIVELCYFNNLAFPNFAKAHTESHRLFSEIPKLLKRSASRFACKYSAYKPEADSSLWDRIRRGGPGTDLIPTVAVLKITSLCAAATVIIVLKAAAIFVQLEA